MGDVKSFSNAGIASITAYGKLAWSQPSSLQTKLSIPGIDKNIVAIMRFNTLSTINASITSLQAIQALLNDITIILTITPSLKQAVKGTDHVNITKEIPHHNLIYLHVWYIIIMSV